MDPVDADGVGKLFRAAEALPLAEAGNWVGILNIQSSRKGFDL